MTSPASPERRVTHGRPERAHPELGGLILLESLYATDWYAEAVEEAGEEAGELLAAIGRDASDQAEELRRVLGLWERAGGEEAARRLRVKLGRALIDLVRQQRRRAAAVLEEAGERAPTNEVEDRLRQLAREARAHAERLDELR